VRNAILGLALYLAYAGIATAQNQDSIQDLRAEIQQLRRESLEMRQQLEAMRQELNALRNPQSSAAASPNSNVVNIAEEQELLKAKVEDQYQTKVESGSKYHVRLSGLALMNASGTRGSVDDLDLPRLAMPRSLGDSNGAFSASARQSRINLEVFGPGWNGMKASGEMSFDFFGGFPLTNDGVSAGLIRLRTATVRLDAPKTSIVGGLDAPFFSPRSPTSLASSAYPSLSSAGNMWVWTPQVQVEHRFALSENDKFSIQGGVLDPLTGEYPLGYNRTPSAGERSGMPAFATRIGFSRSESDHVFGAGAGAYYARQNWGFGRTVDSWAATADWDIPIGKWFSLSGEMYRGRAIGGLGAGASGSVLYAGSLYTAYTSVLPLDSIGGWSQFKYKPMEKMEFNVAYGEDQPFRSGLGRLLSLKLIQGTPVSRNTSGFVNVIYQPRSNLLFSVEYRRLWTYGFYNPRETAAHMSVTTGIAF
jgi:hypothetical protein